MKAYQKLVAYSIIAAGLAGMYGCGKDNTKKDNTNSAASIESVIDNSNTVAVNKPTISVQNKKELFELLKNTKGTYINLFKDNEASLSREKNAFGNGYNDFVHDIAENVSFGGDHRESVTLIQNAEVIANSMNPKADFKRDLVTAVYRLALDYANDGYETLAESRLDSAKKIIQENGIKVNYDFTQIVKAAFKSAEKMASDGYPSLAEADLKFGKKVALEYNIDAKPYASLVAKAAFKNAIGSVKDGYPTLATDDLEFGKKISLEYQIEFRPYILNLIDTAFNDVKGKIKEGHASLTADSLNLGKTLANENGIDIKNYVISVVQTAINTASLDFKNRDINSARGSLNFGKGLAKEYGLEDLVTKIDSMSAKLGN